MEPNQDNSIDEQEKEKQKSKDNNQSIIIKKFGKNTNIFQILKGNSYYLLNRDKYDITKIMMMIDYQRLSILGEKFRACKEGMAKIDFIKEMLCRLRSPDIDILDLTDLVYGIYKYFCEIDFNDDGHVEWAEFTQFIIDKVEGEYGNNEKEEDVKDKIASEKAMVKYKRYELSQFISDYNIHKTEIYSTSYMSKINKLLISEYKTHVIKIYNPLNGKVENMINIHKINDDIEKAKIEELLRNEKNSKEILSESNKARLQKLTKSNSLNKLLGQNYMRKKLQEQKNFGKHYSIINFMTYGSIIAVILSNNKIQFYTTINTISGELLFTIPTRSLQKRIWYLENHNLWLSSGDKEKEEEYYYLNELDIEFQNKSGFPMAITKNLIYRKKYSKLIPHTAEIYDVIEIKKPFLILTACLDGYIRLINITDNEFIKTWKYHNLGVKHLDYNPNLEFNGYIISTGFEYYINIFCTDLSLDDAYKGKLEGHFVPVINCKFICGSPICVSVDEEGNVRIWEIQLRTCLQSIPMSKKNFSVNGLQLMGKINKFIVYGTNILFYDAKYKDQLEDKRETREDNYPIKVCFNKYYQQFYVITQKDIRVFNKKGNLEKTFRKCIDNEYFETGTRIKDFIFEKYHRKFYLGFSNGAIMQYNAGNGSLIKAINQYEVEREGILFFKYQHYKDVSSLFYFHQKRKFEKDNLLLISCSYDSTIQVFNESNLDKSDRLRTFKGGHTLGEKKCEIYCMDFSVNLCQLATGSSDGLIILWSFELSKIKDVLYLNSKILGVKLDVLCIKYLDNYPLLFASYTEGICILWGVKPLDNKYKILLKFHNFYQTLTKLDITNVTTCFFIEEYIKTFEKKFLNKIYFCDDTQSVEERNKIRYDSITGEKLPLIKREDVEKESVTDKSIDPFNFDYIYEKYEKPIADKMVEEYKKTKTRYLVICDKKGYIKLLNLQGIFRKYNEILSKDYHITGSNLNLLKKDDSNVETVLSHLISTTIDEQKYLHKFPFYNLYSTNIINTEFRGHLDEITDVTFIEDPISIVTVASDQYMRIWNENLNLIAEINVLPTETAFKYLKENPVPWNFKINEKKILEKEINEVTKIFEAINIPLIEKGSQLDKKYQKLKFQEKSEINEKKIVDKSEELRKQRFNALKIQKKTEVKKDYMDYDTGYDAIFLKNLTNKIELLIQNKLEDFGIGGISNNLMNSLINQREKKYALLKEKDKKPKLNTSSYENKKKISRGGLNIDNEKDDLNNNITTENNYKKSISTTSLIKYKHSPTQNEKEKDSKRISDHNVKNSNKETTTKNYKNISRDEENLLKKSIKNRSTLKNFTKSSKISRNSLKQRSLLNVNNNNEFLLLSNPLQQRRPVSGIKLHYKPINFLSPKNNSVIKKIKRPSTGYKREVKLCPSGRRGPLSINRNGLYAEKLINLGIENNLNIPRKNFPCIEKIIKDKNLKRKKKFNDINYDIKVKTKNLIKTQFYLNSYKNCCQILPNNSMSTNLSIAHNYRLMWDNVKMYTNDIVNNERNKNIFGKNKNKGVKNKMKIVRSRSVLSFLNK